MEEVYTDTVIRLLRTAPNLFMLFSCILREKKLNLPS